MDGEPEYTLMERLSARPTFDINGVWGGYSGDGVKDDHPGVGRRQVQHAASSRTRITARSSS